MPGLALERVHGGIDEREARRYGVEPDRVIDFSVNLNPYGPPASVLRAAQDASLSAYPDPEAWRAREAWARALETSADRLMVGHGAAELFWVVTRALLAPGDKVVIPEPTFSELRVAALALGAQIERVTASEESGFAIDLDAVTPAAAGARLLYLCSPNNPTGELLPEHAVVELAERLPGTWIVIDQSFLALSDRACELRSRMPDNVIRVRSLTKDFALAGLRIGYAEAHPELVRRTDYVRPTWHTSAPALAAIEQAAHEQAFVAESWARMREDREHLRRGLAELGLQPLPSSSAFQLVRVGDAGRVRDQLFARGVLVRDCTSFGLPAYVRLASRPAPDTERLLDALAGALR